MMIVNDGACDDCIEKSMLCGVVLCCNACVVKREAVIAGSISGVS